jgi:hypothetical protein
LLYAERKIHDSNIFIISGVYGCSVLACLNGGTCLNENDNDCYTCITHLGDLDISIDLLNISSKFLLHLRVLLTITQGHIKISK